MKASKRSHPTIFPGEGASTQTLALPGTLRNAKELRNYTLQAEDGHIGRVLDFYFDDLYWTVRYLVVETGGWLDRRSVLISPEALGTPGWEEKVLPVRLTREQVRQSPEINTAKPVSRQREAELREHYDWPLYWGDADAQLPVHLPPPEPGEPKGDPHLRSSSELFGARIEATDGEIGHVEDFLVNDHRWTIRYLVVSTRNWWPGRKVLLSPWWATDLGWPEKCIRMDLSRSAIQSSPPYDAGKVLSAEASGELHDHYGRTRHPDEDIAEAILRNDKGEL